MAQTSSYVGARLRVESLQGLRAIAIVIVFLVHCSGLLGKFTPDAHTSALLTGFARLFTGIGPDVFLVLSGYFAAVSLLSNRSDVGRFIVRRMARLFPVYLVVLGLYIGLSFLYPTESKLPARPLDALYYVLQNAALVPIAFGVRPIITVAWTVAMILTLCLWFAGIVYVLLPLRTARVIRTFILAALVLSAAVYPAPPLLVRSSIPFIAGVLLRDYAGVLRVSRIACVAIAVVAFGLRSLPLALGDISALMPPHMFPPYVQIVRVCTVLPLIAMLLDRCAPAVENLLSSSAGVQLGDISYSYYLVHGVTLKFLSLWFLPALAAATPALAFVAVALPLSFAATLVPSVICHRLIERRFKLPRVNLSPGASPILAVQQP